MLGLGNSEFETNPEISPRDKYGDQKVSSVLEQSQVQNVALDL